MIKYSSGLQPAQGNGSTCSEKKRKMTAKAPPANDTNKSQQQRQSQRLSRRKLTTPPRRLIEIRQENVAISRIPEAEVRKDRTAALAAVRKKTESVTSQGRDIPENRCYSEDTESSGIVTATVIKRRLSQNRRSSTQETPTNVASLEE
jgi:hypothetical protein